MNWTELKDKVYYCDGSLRDIYVLKTNIEDNKKWVDFVNEHYVIEWFNGLTQTNERQIDFEVVEGYLNGDHDLCSSASILLGKIRINNHFYGDAEIENDIDPREINSMEDHESIIKYMINLSQILGKPVILTPENDPAIQLIRVLNNKIEYP
ncbi:hypothetical protein ACTJIJ_03315 [Niabella sp. 22666]|jgi:hypothetical protein|uniref:hypothetical protein n=1 Tax=Niabella sp. 22666 TaxID=3453954 RepID=UPI003F83D6EB